MSDDLAYFREIERAASPRVRLLSDLVLGHPDAYALLLRTGELGRTLDRWEAVEASQVARDKVWEDLRCLDMIAAQDRKLSSPQRTVDMKPVDRGTRDE